MARANFVKKAQKARPDYGIKKGDSYWWWKLHIRSPKQYSKTQPRRSQLTASSFLSSLWEIEDALADLSEKMTKDEIKSEVESAIDEIRDLGSEQSDNLSNMPEGLQQGSTGELLQGRADSCEEMANELEGIDFDQKVEDIISDLQGISYNGE